MLADRTLNPRWFGHPGSTVIYPTAALSAIWYEAAKELPPFAHAMPGIEGELEANPTPFYMIGRLIVAAYVLGTVIATWLLGRRMLGDLGGGLAASFLPASAIVIQYGQLVRTDTAAMFFAVLALWLTVRALDLRRGRDWAIAAVAIGLAISSRYFFVTLAIPYLVAAVLAVRSARHEDDLHGSSARSLLAPFVALLAAPVTFAITSPYVFLDARRALSDLRTENRAVHPGADGLSPIGNFLWYTTTVAPSIIGLAVLAVAAVGLVVVARRHPRATATLISFVGFLPRGGERLAPPLEPVHHPADPDHRHLRCRWMSRDRERPGGTVRTSCATDALSVAESCRRAADRRLSPGSLDPRRRGQRLASDPARALACSRRIGSPGTSRPATGSPRSSTRPICRRHLVGSSSSSRSPLAHSTGIVPRGTDISSRRARWQVDTMIRPDILANTRSMTSSPGQDTRSLRSNRPQDRGGTVIRVFDLGADGG